MAEKINVAVGGLGAIGAVVIDALKRDDRFTIVAGADPRAEARDKFAADFGARCFTDIDELCAGAEFDLLYITTPQDLHAEHAVRALQAGRHVAVDKPIALTVADADRVVAAARAANRIVIAAHTHSFDPPVSKMAEMAAGGELGPVRMINTWNFNNFMYRPRSAGELDRARGGSIVYNLGPHQLDIVRRIAGRPVRTVRASVGTWDPKRRTDGSYSVFLGFDDGLVATLVLNGYGHFDISELLGWSAESGGFRSRNTQPELRRRLTALGEGEERFRSGMLYGAGGQSLGAWSRIESDDAQDPGDGPRQHVFGLTIVSCERGDIRQSPKGLFVYDVDGCREIDLAPPRSDRAYELDAIYDAVALGKPTFHDGAWGAQTVAILQAMYESAELGREVVLTDALRPK